MLSAPTRARSARPILHSVKGSTGSRTRSTGEAEHRTGEDRRGAAPALDRRNINTLWQSRGEVEHIPPDCLPGEGALLVNPTSSGNPSNIQHVTACHVLPTRGEAATGSSSFQGSKGSRGSALFICALESPHKRPIHTHEDRKPIRAGKAQQRWRHDDERANQAAR